jgi:3-phenylpropionate/trans-cinnamate dioxygenase ferredoxin subunit
MNGMNEFTRACAVSDLRDDGAIAVLVGETPVAVVQSEGQVHAIHDVCSHAEIPLSEGEVFDGEIECWLHGSTFSLTSGRPLSLPAIDPVPVYHVKIDGEDVLVDVANPANASEL